MPKQYWLVKTEPTTFSIDDMKAAGTSEWSGVRNFQARNFMRDQMRLGDGVLVYHSNVEPIGVVGLAEVSREGYPDPTAWDPNDRHYDPKSLPGAPTWFMVDLRYVRHARSVITLHRLKSLPSLKAMKVVQRGVRLSVQPVTPAEWKVLLRLPEWNAP
jgi:predicted RNA-binding protein with PUA-like domain